MFRKGFLRKPSIKTTIKAISYDSACRTYGYLPALAPDELW